MSVTFGTIVAKTGISAGAKAARKAVTEPESVAKWILIIVFIIVAPLLLIVVLLFGMVSGVQGYATSAMDEFLQSDLYEQIQSINSFYEEQKTEQLYERAILEYNLSYPESTSEEETQGELSTEEMKTLLADNHIFFEIEAPNLAYTLAYITHCEDIQSKWGNIFVIEEETAENPSINGRKIRDFYDAITTVQIRTEENEEGEISVTYYLEVMTPEMVALHYWPEDAVTEQMYIESYHQFCEIYDISTVNTILANVNMSVPLYFQSDYRHVKYGRGTIASSGCAPTAIAMCLSYLTGQTITPDVVVNWTGDRYYNYGPGGGSYWSIFSACASHWGCSSTQVAPSNIDAVKGALNNGNPVIASMSSGHFTSSGHFIVICGMTEDGKLIVNDPNRSNYEKHGAAVPAEWVWTESKGYFIFTKGGK